MKKTYNSILSVAVVWIVSGMLHTAVAQPDAFSSVSSFDKSFLNWYNKDAAQDKVQGVGVNRAYKELLASRKPQKSIVVAVIDGGIDISHPELQDKIWTNPNEIPGNGIDDDNNGYVDDIHGWGFLGNSSGENVLYETYEYVRILKQLAPKYASYKSIKQVPSQQKDEYRTYLQCKLLYETELRKQQNYRNTLEAFGRYLTHCESIIAGYLGKKEVTLADIKAVRTKDEQVLRAKMWLLERNRSGFTKEAYLEALENTKLYLEQYLNLEYDARTLVADNPEDVNDRNYGNNDVTGPRPDHGTPVAGIIAGIRGNGQGIDGIAENIKIMALRAVPQGDEYDKDVALAIRYAVDNGAHIINMSFGKDFSPQKAFVDDAIKYAQEHNVLLVHAAGNDARSIDKIANYPNRTLADGTPVSNWIEVGASSSSLKNHFCAPFSNFGRENVDIFAPGVDIISLAPDNQYAKLDGTSFASPVVAGVAALVWSYYPELTALEVKDILLKSCTTYPKLTVCYPDPKYPAKHKKKGKFSSLSRSGGVVNAYGALKLAEQYVKEKASKS